MEMVDPIVFRLTIFVLAIFVGYFVVWSVTPALHTPLMAVTNAISSVIVVGALIAVSVSTVQTHLSSPAAIQKEGVVLESADTAISMPPLQKEFSVPKLNMVERPSATAWTSKILGLFALILASVNIFGGFLVTQRMLAMYKKKGGK